MPSIVQKREPATDIVTFGKFRGKPEAEMLSDSEYCQWSIARIFAPVPIHFTEAIPIAGLGFAVNIASAWLLSGEGHHHGHSHGHEHGARDGHDEPNDVATASGAVRLEVFEDSTPPRFHLRAQSGSALTAQAASVETVRPDGTRQVFIMRDNGDFLESVAEIPEPHAFTANVRIGQDTYPVTFEEHDQAQGFAARDNNMRAAVIHVIADAAVSVLVIVGLLLARAFGWLWMDPLAGIIGACVIASWSYGLIRDTGAILLDMNPDRTMASRCRRRGRSPRRFTPMAVGAGTPRSNCLCGHGAIPRGELL